DFYCEPQAGKFIIKEKSMQIGYAYFTSDQTLFYHFQNNPDIMVKITYNKATGLADELHIDKEDWDTHSAICKTKMSSFSRKNQKFNLFCYKEMQPILNYIMQKTDGFLPTDFLPPIKIVLASEAKRRNKV